MGAFLVLVVIVLFPYILYRVIRYILKERYFASAEFAAHRTNLVSVVAEHNDVGRYAAEIQTSGSFELGSSSTGSGARHAIFQNASHYNYRRDRNVATHQAPNVHPCSLQVARNASVNPIKYLMKYFNINADEETLGRVEKIGESIARLDGAVNNLHQRAKGIADSIQPPPFIMKHYRRDFFNQVGVEMRPIVVPFPVYVFEYVSAGGNSAQRTTIKLDSPTIDALIEALSLKIQWKKSAAGQRSLMTVKLRNYIKSRDGYACKMCDVSVADEPNLLLEVDHINPISRGGLSTPDNLQTLCWRCNRSKSNKT
jgi:hypothetical protein